MDAVYVDSNVVIRFLTKTPAHQYARALALMQRVSRGEVELLLSAAVVGEVAAVLHHSYELPQRDVAEQLLAGCLGLRDLAQAFRAGYLVAVGRIHRGGTCRPEAAGRSAGTGHAPQRAIGAVAARES